MEEFLDLIKDDMQKVEEEFQNRLASQVPRLTEGAQIGRASGRGRG